MNFLDLLLGSGPQRDAPGRRMGNSELPDVVVLKE